MADAIPSGNAMTTVNTPIQNVPRRPWRIPLASGCEDIDPVTKSPSLSVSTVRPWDTMSITSTARITTDISNAKSINSMKMVPLTSAFPPVIERRTFSVAAALPTVAGLDITLTAGTSGYSAWHSSKGWNGGCASVGLPHATHESVCSEVEREGEQEQQHPDEEQALEREGLPAHLVCARRL